MTDTYAFPKRAENVVYRFEDRDYSVSDEYGEHAYTSRGVELKVFPLLKYTPCGIWIWTNYSLFPTMPPEYNPDKNYHIGEKRFVNLQANKKYALPTIEGAIESYMARKNRQIAIYEARIGAAKRHKEALIYYTVNKIPKSMLPSSERLRGLLEVKSDLFELPR